MSALTKRDEQQIVMLRNEADSLTGENALRPGDQVYVYLANGVPMAIIGDTPPDIEMIKQETNIEDIVPLPPDGLTNLPVGNMPVVAVGSLLLAHPELVGESGTVSIENLAQLMDELPWHLGYLLSVIHDRWKDSSRSEVDGMHRYFEGESFDGVAERLTRRQYTTYMGWIQAARLFMRNVMNAEWLRALTLDVIVSTPISKAIAAANAMSSNEITMEAVAAIFGGQPLDTVRHLLAGRKNGVHPDKLPLDTVAGAVHEGRYVPPPEPGEIPSEPDSFLTPPEEEFVKSGSDKPVWRYDEQTGVIGYWLSTVWTPGFRVLSDDEITVHQLHRLMMIGNIQPVKTRMPDMIPSYDTPHADDAMEILYFYDSVLRDEDATAVRKQSLENGVFTLKEITRAVRTRLKLELLEQHGDRCPINPFEQATDLHEVMLTRAGATPAIMLAIGAFNADNCILVSRAVNAQAENSQIRGRLISTMLNRGRDPLGWIEKLKKQGVLKAFTVPSFELPDED